HAGRPLVINAVYLRRDVKAMPVHDVFVFGVVPDADDDGLSLPGTEERARNLTVVRASSDRSARRQVERDLPNPKGDVGRPLRREVLTWCWTRFDYGLTPGRRDGSRPVARQRQELTAGHALDANTRSRETSPVPPASRDGYCTWMDWM